MLLHHTMYYMSVFFFNWFYPGDSFSNNDDQLLELHYLIYAAKFKLI